MSNNKMFTSSRQVTGNSKVKKLNYLLLPIAIVLIIIPLIVHEYIFSPEISKEAWFASGVKASDFFLFYKSMFLTGIGVVILGILLYRQFMSKNKPFDKLYNWFIPLAMYAILGIVSGITSAKSNVAWNGSYEQFDTVLVLITYCLLTIYAFYVLNTIEDLNLILNMLYIGIGILTVIGILQLIGLDPFATTIGKYLISVDKSKESIDALQFSFEKNRVYMTLFNPNYVGVLGSLLFPITMGMTIVSDNKKKKIISGILSLTLVICVFGAQSKTGLITVLGTGILVIIVLWKRIFKSKKSIIVLLGSFVLIVVAFFIVNTMQNNAYLNSIKNALFPTEQQHMLEKIETHNDYVLIKYNGKPLYVKCILNEEGQIDFSVANENDERYDVSFDNDSMTFTIVDQNFNGMSFMPAFLGDETTFGFEAIIDGKEWYFKSKTDTDGYLYLNKYNKLEDIITPSISMFEKHQSAFTGRGYLWSRTIPLIKDYILIGSGPNTFVYEFPQNDYVGKYNNGFDGQLVTKPHNMYLQMAIETGVVSCISFIALCLMYIIAAIRTFKKSNLDTIIEQLGMLVMVSIIGYLVSGLINDFTTGVAPFFWVLLGVGFACIKITKNNELRKQKLKNM